MLILLIVFLFTNSFNETKQRTVEELKSLEKGKHVFLFRPSKLKSAFVANMKEQIFFLNRSGEEIKGDEWVHVSEDNNITFFQPRVNTAIYIYADRDYEMMTDELDGYDDYKTDRLIGFINYEYYEWVREIYFVKSLDNIYGNASFDPHSKMLKFEITVK
ncbi:hypothetical protein [Reichenbachiella sp.]